MMFFDDSEVNRTRRRKGQSLADVLIAVALGALMIVAAVTVIAPALQAQKQGSINQTATSLGKELLDNVNALAEGNWQNIAGIATSSANHYYLNTAISPFRSASGDEGVTVGPITYRRYFYVDDVYRDASGNATTTAAGNNFDPSTKKITVYAVASSTAVSLTSPDTGYHTYSNAGQPCTGSNYYVASTPDGYPIANINHADAVSYCSALGAHLLTNDEYMTVVRSAEQVNSNWSGGSPGVGYLYSGHNDNAPGYALTASTDDSQGYYGETNTGGNQRRTLTLSNGSVVWDFAGNVWERVQRSVMNSGDATTTMALPACSTGTVGWVWCQYGSSLTPYVSAWSTDVAQANVGPSNTSWNSNQGVGQVYTYGTGANQGTNAFLRGAGWSYGSSAAGAFALYLYWNTSSTVNDVAFRCAATSTPPQSAGWVPVPGASAFGTQNFYTMKYEAKCAATAPIPNPPAPIIYSTYITRNQGNALLQTDWSGGPGQSGPVKAANNLFATSASVTVTTAGQIQLAPSTASCQL